MGTTPSKEETPHDVLPRKSFKRAKVCLSSRIVPKKSSQFQIPNLVQVSAKTWLSNGSLPTHVPKKVMMKETKVYVFLPLLFPTFPMTNPTQKVQKWSTFSCS
jgi:hypothetical protein